MLQNKIDTSGLKCDFGSLSLEMAEKESLSVAEVLSEQSGHLAPSAGAVGVLHDGLSFTPLDSNGDKTVQPFPRSPKLQRKPAKAGQPSQVNKPTVVSGRYLTVT